MKRVLFITHSFPPLATAGVQRAVSFVRHLPSFGWEPTVLTVGSDPAYGIDRSTCARVPPSVTVVRTGMLSPVLLFKALWGLRLHRVAALIGKAVLFPDDKIGWFPFAVRAALRICREKRIDVVYTTSPPETAQLIGLYLKRRLRLPWVVDYRNEWFTNPYAPVRGGGLRAAAHARLERQVARTADGVITLSPAHTRMMVEEDPANASKYATIENGFDADEFADAAAAALDPRPTARSDGPRTLPDSDVLKVVYVGVFHSTMDGSTFFEVCDRLLTRGAIDRKRFRFCMAGYPWRVGKYRRGRESWFEYLGYLERHDALRLMHTADLLLLLIRHDAPRTLPGKLYEYIATGKPILALVPPEGLAADIVRRTRTGFVVPPDRPEEVENLLGCLYRKWAEGGLKVEPSREEVARYERSIQVPRLAEILAAAEADGRARRATGR
ncbi:MAG: glycosyltransferase [Planctomycetota bacterium]|nr:glycosyltransferase [Planctomycetota bacterium]